LPAVAVTQGAAPSSTAEARDAFCTVRSRPDRSDPRDRILVVEANMAAKDDLGRRGELVAASWLEKHGYTVLERNWRCRIGELDLVARRGSVTVFAEVKTRTSVAYGHPFEAINPAKARRLRQLSVEWCRRNGPGIEDIRVDAISVIDAWSANPRVEHLQGIA
jgi:putative endonuclease